MKPRAFIVEHGPSKDGPWERYKRVDGVRVGYAALPDARACRARHTTEWTRVRREDSEKPWCLWAPLAS